MPAPESFLTWVFRALGLKYSVLLPLAAIVAFVLTLVVLLRGKGPMAAAALVFIVPMPFFVGLYGGIDGLIAIYTIIAASAAQPKPSELAEGTSMALAAPMIGMLLMAPAYLLAMVGLFVHSMMVPKDCKQP